jgi:hypothetical protein
MKTTIKLSETRSIYVEPVDGGVLLVSVFKNIEGITQPNVIGVLTPDQIGALIFGLEAAEEASQIHQQRAASVAHGVDL